MIANVPNNPIELKNRKIIYEEFCVTYSSQFSSYVLKHYNNYKFRFSLEYIFLFRSNSYIFNNLLIDKNF